MRHAIYLTIIHIIVMTVVAATTYQLGWANRGDAIYSSMFESTVSVARNATQQR